MNRSISDIFHDRTHYKFLDKKIPENTLREIYDLMKLGPTSANTCPLRILFLTTQAAKERLYPCLMPDNVGKSKSADVVALFAYDAKFYDFMPKLFPHNPGFKDYFSNSEAITLDTAYRNSTLQAAYFMIIARNFGIACGAMSGFNEQAVNKEFFTGTNHKINFICNLGYPEGEPQYGRLPRLDFEESCKII